MRKSAPFALVAAITVAACGGAAPSAVPATPVPSATAATATAAAMASEAGWVALFEGTLPDAFRGYNTESFPASWAVDAGNLHALPGAGTDLISRDVWADFELEFEWRVAAGGNSGVIYRVDESDAPSWTTGPEYQVLDDAGHPDGRDPVTSAAALYGLRAPTAAKHLRPLGDFNTGRIVVRDGHVEHWLNGELVVAYDWDGADVRTAIAASKFRDLGGFMRAAAGHVVLQHHGEEAWFRNVRIRPLP